MAGKGHYNFWLGHLRDNNGNRVPDAGRAMKSIGRCFTIEPLAITLHREFCGINCN
jgi:hypothetical protein